jgi:xylulokinase
MISGERAPVRDPHASGVFFGIRRTTTRADLYRAVLEGVAYAMRTIRDVMQAMMPVSAQFQELYLTGGGARSALWAQIFADVMGCTVKVLASPEDVGVKGMAIVAGKTLGWHDDYIPDGSFIQWEAVYQPSPDENRYRREYPIYTQLYPSLKPLFEQSARLRAEEKDQ